MPPSSRRPLTLHVSALSDAEYSSYTASLGELISPTANIDWENAMLSVREARGWIRGRYGATVDGAVIDQILKRFSTELGPHDILTGGQFFAVLRLVCHAQTGAPVDDSLVFVQANPEPAKPKEHTVHRSLSTKSAPPPPPRHPTETAPSSAAIPTLPPRSAPPIPSPNPFTRSLSTPGPKRPRQDAQHISDRGPEKPSSDSPLSSNPFRTQPPPSSPPKPTQALPSISSASSSSSSPSNPRQYAYAYATPPLPPRKPSATALLPPPRHASLTTPSAQKSRGHASPGSQMTASKSYSISSPGLPPPPKPPKPPQATSPLIKQSLQAAKGAQSVKSFMEGLSKERRLEVIKKSGGGGTSGGQNGSGSSGSGGTSVTGSRTGEGAPYRNVSPPHSFYDVAAARIGRTSSPSSISSSSDTSSLKDADVTTARADATGPPHSHHHAGTPNKPTPQFPFAHVITPNTPSTTSPSPSRSAAPSTTSFPTFSPNASPTHSGFSPTVGTTRRTRSLHHPSPASSPDSSPAPGPPMPPPRRRRPESVQVTSGLGLGSPFGNVNGSESGDGCGTGPGPGVARRSSASVSSPLFWSTGERGDRSNGNSSNGGMDGVNPNSASGAAGTAGAQPESGVLDALHRTFATLRPGPGFESARVRAEGRVWPSGYVKGLARGRAGGEGEGGRLVNGDMDRGDEGDGEGDGGFGQDGGWEDEKVGTGRKSGLGGMERDELKMPVRPGEGWTTLG